LHRDHFDTQFLREHISKEATVLLPDFPLDLMERELQDLGFTRFVRTNNFEPVDLDGLRVTIAALVAPTDGPLGDSGLIVDDGETRIFDQNDSRPVDLETLTSFGPFDAHFLQFSGAIWFPMVYDMPEKAKHALGVKKRANQLSRALRYVRQIDASFVVPHAGPPCFLDDDLFHFNDLDRDPSNIFPTRRCSSNSCGNRVGQRLVDDPGSVVHLRRGNCQVEHSLPEDEVRAIFSDKRAYLEDYKARKQHLIDDVKGEPAARAGRYPLSPCENGSSRCWSRQISTASGSTGACCLTSRGRRWSSTSSSGACTSTKTRRRTTISSA
jgi:UDP-MurNAc hydroxylase